MGDINRPDYTVLQAAVRTSGVQYNSQAQAHPDTADLFVAQGLPPYTEMARQGLGWQAMATAAVAALVVRPTTVAIATLWNGEPAGGKTLIMDAAFAHNLVGVANSDYGIWLCVHPVGMAAPTNDITVRNSMSGRPANSGNARTFFDNGATVADDGWFPWGNSVANVTITVPGGQVEAKIEGRIIIPPTAGISISIVADTTGVTSTCGFRWFEKALTLGW